MSLVLRASVAGLLALTTFEPHEAEEVDSSAMCELLGQMGWACGVGLRPDEEECGVLAQALDAVRVLLEFRVPDERTARCLLVALHDLVGVLGGADPELVRLTHVGITRGVQARDSALVLAGLEVLILFSAREGLCPNMVQPDFLANLACVAETFPDCFSITMMVTALLEVLGPKMDYAGLAVAAGTLRVFSAAQCGLLVARCARALVAAAEPLPPFLTLAAVKLCTSALEAYSRPNHLTPEELARSEFACCQAAADVLTMDGDFHSVPMLADLTVRVCRASMRSVPALSRVFMCLRRACGQLASRNSDRGDEDAASAVSAINRAALVCPTALAVMIQLGVVGVLETLFEAFPRAYARCSPRSPATVLVANHDLFRPGAIRSLRSFTTSSLEFSAPAQAHGPANAQTGKREETWEGGQHAPCPLCARPILDALALARDCGHVFHVECTMGSAMAWTARTCPGCRLC